MMTSLSVSSLPWTHRLPSSVPSSCLATASEVGPTSPAASLSALLLVEALAALKLRCERCCVCWGEVDVAARQEVVLEAVVSVLAQKRSERLLGK